MNTVNASQYACIIPVAGLSSRMGAFKPLLTLKDGKTIIEHTIQNALDAGIGQCILILGHQAFKIKQHIEQAMPNKNIQFVFNPFFKTTDMLYSIQLGIKALANKKVQGCFIIPGDMPCVASQTFCCLMAYFEQQKQDTKVVFPQYNQQSKHPPLISKECFSYIVQFKQDGGLRKALAHFLSQTKYLSIDDVGCCLDADTKQEYLFIRNLQS